MSAAWPLQKSVYAALAAAPVLQTYLGAPARVFDEPPEDAAFPFLLVGEASERDIAATGGETSEHIFLLHAWSRGGGRKEAKLILAAAHAVLHDQMLAVEGHRLVNLRCAESSVVREDDGETYHGLARFRAVTEPET